MCRRVSPDDHEIIFFLSKSLEIYIYYSVLITSSQWVCRTKHKNSTNATLILHIPINIPELNTILAVFDYLISKITLLFLAGLVFIVKIAPKQSIKLICYMLRAEGLIVFVL